MSSRFYVVVWLKSALKQLNQLKKRTQIAIVTKIKQLSENGAVNDTKKMQGHENLFRIRIGDYRVVYYLDKAKKQCLISDVAHRKEVYRLMHTNFPKS